MGQSSKGSSTMRTFLVLVTILLVVPALLAEDFNFKNVKIKVGKKTCTCTITFVVNGGTVNLKQSKASCDKKCPKCVPKKTCPKNEKLDAFTFDMTTNKGGKATITKATVKFPATTTEPTVAVPTVMPTGETPVNVTGEIPIPITSGPPPTGQTPIPITTGETPIPLPPGPGNGHYCPEGFASVCSKMGEHCPADAFEVCPMMGGEVETRMDMGALLDMRAGHADMCECIPWVVMELVIAQPEMGPGPVIAGRSLNRAGTGGDTFKNEKIKVGKKTCTCTITFKLKGSKVDLKASKASCDKKCPKCIPKKTCPMNQKLGGPMGKKNLYTFDMTTNKGGKATITKATVSLANNEPEPEPEPTGSGTGTPEPEPEPTGSGSGYGSGGTGSGHGGGGIGPVIPGDFCVCVFSDMLATK